MKFAAIDIGSNAVRFQVSKVNSFKGVDSFKKIEYVRFPLRLGEDVFSKGVITDRKFEKFEKLLHSFRILMDLYEVDEYLACATSAMREARNGKKISKKIKNDLGIKIQVISGQDEALMIKNALKSSMDKGYYVHIDVGGGSTELNIFLNQQKVESSSFRIGTVRSINEEYQSEVWEAMKKWVEKKTKYRGQEIVAVGTGGNINKLAELSYKKPGKLISYKKLKSVKKYISGFSFNERVNYLQMNEDRADVILPASEIYLSVMRWSGAKKILVPNIGLKDGIIQYLYDKHISQLTFDFPLNL